MRLVTIDESLPMLNFVAAATGKDHIEMMLRSKILFQRRPNHTLVSMDHSILAIGLVFSVCLLVASLIGRLRFPSDLGTTLDALLFRSGSHSTAIPEQADQ